MKLPSLHHVALIAKSTFCRFPVVLITAFVGTVCALVLIESGESSAPTNLIPFVFGAILGLPLFTGLALISEKWKWSRSVSIGINSVGILLVAVFASTIPSDYTDIPARYPLRLVALTISMALFALAAPYVRHANELGYWQYCKAIFLRAFHTAFYSIVLNGGLSIALAALDFLFGIDIPGRRYPELIVFINGIFMTWFFLAGVPKNLEQLDNLEDYPNALKVFSQYILIPLVIVYFLILYAYLGKIVFLWSLPKGWVSRLILGFIATGLTSILLVYPIRNREGNRWIQTVARWFFPIILPLTLMLFLAVWQRVSDYGITEGRYLGIAVVVWLTFLAPYFIFSKRKSLLFLPVTLCLTALIVSLGPWSMFAVSERSQVKRLEKMLIDQHILVNGKVVAAHDTVRTETAQQISSILWYLSDFHGYESIQPWFQASLRRDSIGEGITYESPEDVAKKLGITYHRTWQATDDGVITLTADRDVALNVGECNRLIRRQRVYSGTRDFKRAEQSIAYRFNDELNEITFIVGADSLSKHTLQIDLRPMFETLLVNFHNTSTDKIPPDQLSITSTHPAATIKLFISSIQIQIRDGKTKVLSLDADIAYRLPEE